MRGVAMSHWGGNSAQVDKTNKDSLRLQQKFLLTEHYENVVRVNLRVDIVCLSDVSSNENIVRCLYLKVDRWLVMYLQNKRAENPLFTILWFSECESYTSRKKIID